MVRSSCPCIDRVWVGAWVLLWEGKNVLALLGSKREKDHISLSQLYLFFQHTALDTFCDKLKPEEEDQVGQGSHSCALHNLGGVVSR